MPFLTPENKKKSIAKLIAKLEADKEVAKRDINALLTPNLQVELIAKWNEQQALRKVKKPISLNQYEKLHKQALMLSARYDKYIVSAKVISNVIVDRKLKKEELAIKAKLAIKNAQDYLVGLLDKKKELAVWFDRDVKLKNIDLVGKTREHKTEKISIRDAWNPTEEDKLEALKPFEVDEIKTIRCGITLSFK